MRRGEVRRSSWFAATAAATVFLTVFSFSDWPFGQVNPTFLPALLFGGSMAMGREGLLRFRWSTPGPLVGRRRHENSSAGGIPSRDAGG
mgnify:FL=1